MTLYDHPLISLEETVRLCEIVQSSQDETSQREAMDALIKAHARLVLTRARKKYRRNSHLQIEDLTQEGFIGLMRAVNKFDPTRGVQFSTYATIWIDHFIQRVYENEEFMIRFPSYRHEIANSEGKPLQNLTELLGVSVDSFHDLEWVQYQPELESQELSLPTGALDNLEPREKQVLILYYGIEEGSKPATLREIGVLLGISHEKVRIIRNKALVKIKNEV